MTRNAGDRSEHMIEEITRQFGTTGTTRFLRAQPLLQLDPGMPRQFMDLLAELDRAEGRVEHRNERRSQ